MAVIRIPFSVEIDPKQSINMTFAGKGVAVTGAASGIGRATAISFGRQGACVALYDRNAAGLAGTARRLTEAGGEARPLTLDVSNATQVHNTIDDLARTRGGLAVLVNAAGISKAGTTSHGPVVFLASEAASDIRGSVCTWMDSNHSVRMTQDATSRQEGRG